MKTYNIYVIWQFCDTPNITVLSYMGQVAAAMYCEAASKASATYAGATSILMMYLAENKDGGVPVHKVNHRGFIENTEPAYKVAFDLYERYKASLKPPSIDTLSDESP